MTDRRRARGNRHTGTGRTLSEWWPYWENELGARDCRPATVTTNEKGFKKLTRFLGDIPAKSLTTDQVEQWRDHMANVQQHKPNTINGHLRWIGSFYNWLMAKGVIAESPIAQVNYVRCKDGFAYPPVFDAPQVQQLIAGARRGQRSGRGAHDVLRNEAIMLLLADTGIRASECAGLLLDNVNLAGTSGARARGDNQGPLPARRHVWISDCACAQPLPAPAV